MRPINRIDDVPLDHLSLDLVEQLVMYEEAKANGKRITPKEPTDDSVRDGLACVDLLHRVWPDLESPAIGNENPPPKTLGDFRLIREIGRGGMGTVFEAEQISMGRHVALKVLPFAALVHENSLHRFRNEVRAAAALNHPHIVPVYSIGEERGVHFYAMQLIRGRTLADVIAELRGTRRIAAGSQSPTIDSNVVQPPSTKRDAQARIGTAVDSRRAVESYRIAARLGIEAAEALQHAHDQGVLHRDIKPSNLMLDSEGKLFVTDFGLARIEADAGMTMTGDIVGTLRYMAPEQALAKRVVIDHRADIYALGATLYELLTLQPAFGETDRSELLKQIAFEEPRPLRKLDHHIPAELETIVLKAMGKNPDERYQMAQQLSDDLRAYLEDRPIKAKPPTRHDQIVKWSRRHPAVIWATLLVFLVTTIISTVSAVLVTRAYSRESVQRVFAEEQRQRAEAERERAETNFARAKSVVAHGLFDPARGHGKWSELPLEYRKRFAAEAAHYYKGLLREDSANPSLKSETAVGYQALASVHNAFNEYEQAEQLILKSIAIHNELFKKYPNDFIYLQRLAWSNFSLGSTLEAQRKSSEAESAYRTSIAMYKRLIQEGPTETDYIQEVCRCYNALIQFKSKQDLSTDDLEDDFVLTARQAVQRGPKKLFNQYYLAVALCEADRCEEAIQAFRETLRMKPDYPTVSANLAWILVSCADERLRDPQTAVEFANQAVKSFPKDGFSWLVLGAAQYRVGHWRPALEALQKSIDQDGFGCQNGFVFAMCNWQLGDREAARRWNAKAVEMMEKAHVKDTDLVSIRSEAERLIGRAELQAPKAAVPESESSPPIAEVPNARKP